MQKRLITLAITSLIAMGSTQTWADIDDHFPENGTTDVTSVGAGAVGGALLAGPPGLIAGSILGGLFGMPDEKEAAEVALSEANYLQPEIHNAFNTTEAETDVQAGAQTTAAISETDEAPLPEDEAVATVEEPTPTVEPLLVATASDSLAVVEPAEQAPSDRLEEFAANLLSIDIYFKQGSIEVEQHHIHQLATAAHLMQELPQLKIRLDSYADRVGDAEQNMRLSVERMVAVEQFLLAQGVEAERMLLQPHGEANFLSKPGDLAGYMFDRRVVISFELPAGDGSGNIAAVDTPPVM